MKSRFALATAAALLSTAASAGLLSAPTADVTVRINGFSNGYAAVDVTLDPHGQIGAGQFEGLLNGVSFLTYCTDLAQSFSWRRDYTYTPVANGSAHGFTETQADLLGKLYTLAGGDATNNDDSVAFQLAVWEIMSEAAAPSAVTSGSFRLLQGASTLQRNLANDWLEAINDADAAKSFNAMRLYSSIAQDFVVFTEIPIPATRLRVPEPAGYALVGLALAGLALARRRH